MYYLAPCSSLVFILSILASTYYGQDPKHCDGNYISPSYEVITFNITSKYTLKRHIEAGSIQKGTPVLFIPGNAGNCKQIRSLGGVAARIWNYEFKSHPTLELYTIDTNEELSAFSPNILHEQALYVNEAIAHIFTTYHHTNVPKSVFVIGHSMGGIVARYLPLLPNFQKNSVIDIFTLSSPHMEAPIALSRSLDAFYKNLNAYWYLNHRDGGALENMTLTSIAGGTRDTTLDSQLTYLEGVSDPKRTIDVFSTGVPNMWTSADHEGAVWCDQILQSLSKAIFKVHSLQDQKLDNRMQVLRNIFRPEKVLYPELKYISQRDVQINLHESYLSIPKLRLSKNEVRMHKIWLPPREFQSLYRFKMVTDVPDVEVYSCEGIIHEEIHECLSLDSLSTTVVVPQDDFKIIFRSLTSPPSENRKNWKTYNIAFEDQLKDHQFFIVQAKGGSNGFIFADVTQTNQITFRLDSWIHYIPFIPYHIELAPKSVLTSVEFPNIKSGILKYRLKFKAKGVLKPQFRPFGIQQVANELKLLNANSLISIYPPFFDTRNKGLLIDIWVDKDIELLDVFLMLDILGTLSVLTAHLRNIWLSLGMSIVILVFIGHSFRMLVSGKVVLATLVLSILCYIISGTGVVLLAGKHGFWSITLFPLLWILAVGLIKSLHFAVFTFISLLSLAAKRRLSFLHASKFKLCFAVSMLLSLIIMPICILSIPVLLYTILITVNERSRSSLLKESRDIPFILLQLIIFVLRVPSLAQYLSDIRQGLVHNLSNDYILFLFEVIYILTIHTSSKALKRDYTTLIAVCALILVIFGFKKTYLVIESVTLILAVISIGELVQFQDIKQD